MARNRHTLQGYDPVSVCVCVSHGHVSLGNIRGQMFMHRNETAIKLMRQVTNGAIALNEDAN